MPAPGLGCIGTSESFHGAADEGEAIARLELFAPQDVLGGSGRSKALGPDRYAIRTQNKPASLRDAMFSYPEVIRRLGWGNEPNSYFVANLAPSPSRQASVSIGSAPIPSSSRIPRP